MGETDHTELLGSVVRDRVSGMEGIVTIVGDHLTGCTRIEAQPTDVSETSRGSNEFFYPAQLEVIEDTHDVAADSPDPRTSSPVSVGDQVEDEVTGFEGVACVINYKLWNTPMVSVQSLADADEQHWYDDTRLTVLEDERSYSFDDLDDAPTTETGAIDDGSSRELKSATEKSYT